MVVWLCISKEVASLQTANIHSNTLGVVVKDKGSHLGLHRCQIKNHTNAGATVYSQASGRFKECDIHTNGTGVAIHGKGSNPTTGRLPDQAQRECRSRCIQAR